MSLEIRSVDKMFSTKSGASTQHVLRGVDLSIATGEFVSFIGHSGCGKSTLLNIVGGLLRADRGEVLLDGQPVSGPGPDRAMVFQNYSLLPRMSLFDNVLQATRAARPDRGRARNDEVVERFLRAVGLWEHRSKRPAQVSGGMQQRCAVARAFAVSPRVLILDEPFGALDALTRARLQVQLLELWQGEDSTEMVLMVTHAIDEAIALADRVVVMGNPPWPSVVEVIDVDLPRPRMAEALSANPAYHALHHELLGLLTKYDPAHAA